MARDYCVNRVVSQGQYFARCQDANAKMVDAAVAEGVGAQFQAMTADLQACIENAERLKARQQFTPSAGTDRPSASPR